MARCRDVVDLDAVEPGGRQVGDRFLGHRTAALGGGGVREHGHPSRTLDQPERLEGVGLVLLDVGPATVGQPVLGEGVVHGRDDAQFHQGGGHVRSADRAVPGDPGDLLPGDGHTQFVELGDHALGPRHPVVPDQLALGEQGGLLGIEEVGQHVHADAVEAAGELGTGDEDEPLGQRGDGLGMSAGGVVVRQRDDVETGRRGLAHQLGRGVRAVGRGGVGVQIDAHDADSKR
ncbi:hypothetical protein STENM36S_08447 [Streptomyces tendae]